MASQKPDISPISGENDAAPAADLTLPGSNSGVRRTQGREEQPESRVEKRFLSSDSVQAFREKYQPVDPFERENKRIAEFEAEMKKLGIDGTIDSLLAAGNQDDIALFTEAYRGKLTAEQAARLNASEDATPSTEIVAESGVRVTAPKQKRGWKESSGRMERDEARARQFQTIVDGLGLDGAISALRDAGNTYDRGLFVEVYGAKLTPEQLARLTQENTP